MFSLRRVKLKNEQILPDEPRARVVPFQISYSVGTLRRAASVHVPSEKEIYRMISNTGRQPWNRGHLVRDVSRRSKTLRWASRVSSMSSP